MSVKLCSCDPGCVHEYIAALEAEVSNLRFGLTDALVREDALKAQVERLTAFIGASTYEALMAARASQQKEQQ